MSPAIPSIPAPAGIIDLHSRLYLIESFLLCPAFHMYAGQFFGFGNPGSVIILVNNKFSHGYEYTTFVLCQINSFVLE